jgi:hypothetical protein
MPDLFSQFGQPQQNNPYMWPPLQGSFGFGKQGLMGAAGAGELPPQAQGQGVPGGDQGGPAGFTPPTPPSLPPPDMSALGTTPLPPPSAAALPPAPGAAGAPPSPVTGEAGLFGTPANPTIAGQVQGPMPGVPGGSISASAALNPANYGQMIQNAKLAGSWRY